MIAGIGIDIIDVKRIEKILCENNGDRFMERTFTPGEQEYCNKFKDPFPRYAGRFAVKEAFIKAANHLCESLSLKEIETVNASSGAPSISIISKKFDKEKYNIHVSISHIDRTAGAFVIIENKEEGEL